MATYILGVTGKKRSGKDTFARRLVDAHGFTRLGFADALKGTMLALDPIVSVEMDEVGLVYGSGVIATRERHVRLTTLIQHMGWEAAKEVREVRRLLQAHGVGIREHVDPEVWVDAVRRRADETDGPVVITDVRFPNEYDYVLESGLYGSVARVIRPGLETADTHVSETALDDYVTDHDVINDGTVADLHAKADEIVATLGYFL